VTQHASTSVVPGAAASRRRARTRVWPGVALAAAVFVACLLLALAFGPASLSLRQIWGFVTAGPVQGNLENAIFWQIRLPRVLLASLVGAELAVAGVVLQNLFLNPLTDPYVTGVSSGAALGATVGIVLHLAELPWLAVLALAGGFLTLSVVWMAARRRARIDVFVLLLAGVTISYLASAVVTVLMIKANQDMHAIVYWLMGSFSGRGWTEVVVALAAVPFMLVPLFYTAEMDIMLQGEKRAQELGVEVERTKRMLLITAGVLTAMAVSVSGVIGFVGLVVPHIVRLLVGPSHRSLLPVSLFAGAAMLAMADLLSRTLIAPNEMPVGVVTTFVGAPLFVYLLRRGRRGS
jgi:iron complex transport system permease protein